MLFQTIGEERCAMVKLEWYHYRTLEHAESAGLTELRYDGNIPLLESMGYLHGSWFGSLDGPAMAKWEITSEGRKALKEHKRQTLIASISQCPDRSCKGAYATECYLETDCIICGRIIDQRKKAG